MIRAKHRAVGAVGQCEKILSGVRVDDALMQMQRAAGFAGHRLRHERRVDAMLQRGFARDPLEQEYLIGELEWIAVQEVDLELAGAVFVGQRVRIDFHRFAVVVDVFDDRVEFIHRIDAVRATRAFFAACAPDRRFERIVRIFVLLHEVELDLRRDDRLPAFVRVHFQERSSAPGAARARAAPCRADSNRR